MEEIAQHQEDGLRGITLAHVLGAYGDTITERPGASLAVMCPNRAHLLPSVRFDLEVEVVACLALLQRGALRPAFGRLSRMGEMHTVQAAGGLAILIP